jgi:hypothetical protein
MARTTRWFVRVVAPWGACAVLAAGCRQSKDPPRPAASAALPPPSSAPVADPSRLPEDPVAGKAAEAQWREHLVEEERERQMAFDGARMKAHRGVVALFAAAQTQYDRAPNEAALKKARADMAGRVAEIRRRVTEIDHHGNSSHLLKDYDALQALLSADYADAKLAALQGDGRRLEESKSRFEQHMKAIADWLEEVEEEEEEHEHAVN